MQDYLSPSQSQGIHYEQMAIEYLKNHGLHLLDKNLSCYFGEIDCVMKEDEHTLIFVEVRYRRNRQFGGASASITPSKRRKFIRTAQYFLPILQARYFAGLPCYSRFDVVCIEGKTLHWIKNAFSLT